MAVTSDSPNAWLDGIVDRFERPRTLGGWVVNSARQGEGRDITVTIRRQGRVIAEGGLDSPRIDLVDQPNYLAGFRLTCSEDIPDEEIAFGKLQIVAQDTSGRFKQLAIYDRTRATALTRLLHAAPPLGRAASAVLLDSLAQNQHLSEAARQALSDYQRTYLETDLVDPRAAPSTPSQTEKITTDGSPAFVSLRGHSGAVGSMSKKVAVISDTIASDQMFRTWYAYYARLFGAKNLYLVTYRNLSPQFAGLELGGVWEIPEDYNDRARSTVISSLVGGLLANYDYVVRADVDELVVPDPRSAPNLAAYIDALDPARTPYRTGRGLEIVQTAGEPPLDFNSPILVRQRRFAFCNSGIYKTCLTSIPLDWGSGFHGSTVYPRLSDLYIMHLKFSDLTSRRKWFQQLVDSTPGNEAVAKYCINGIAGIDAMQDATSRRQPVAGWDAFSARDFDERYLTTVGMDRKSRIYQGDFFTDNKLREIPAEFDGIL